MTPKPDIEDLVDGDCEHARIFRITSDVIPEVATDSEEVIAKRRSRIEPEFVDARGWRLDVLGGRWYVKQVAEIDRRMNQIPVVIWDLNAPGAPIVGCGMLSPDWSLHAVEKLLGLLAEI